MRGYYNLVLGTPIKMFITSRSHFEHYTICCIFYSKFTLKPFNPFVGCVLHLLNALFLFSYYFLILTSLCLNWHIVYIVTRMKMECFLFSSFTFSFFPSFFLAIFVTFLFLSSLLSFILFYSFLSFSLSLSLFRYLFIY